MGIQSFGGGYGIKKKTVVNVIVRVWVKYVCNTEHHSASQILTLSATVLKTTENHISKSGYAQSKRERNDIETFHSDCNICVVHLIYLQKKQH